MCVSFQAVRRVGLKNAVTSRLGMDATFAKISGLDFYDANWQNYEVRNTFAFTYKKINI